MQVFVRKRVHVWKTDKQREREREREKRREYVHFLANNTMYDHDSDGCLCAFTAC